jgi:hypothetical protein
MLNERTRRGGTVLGLLGASLALTACSPVTSVVIRLSDEEGFVISAREECDYVLDDIEVRYRLDDVPYADMPLVWAATAEEGEGSKEVRLFEPNAGYEVNYVELPVDESREIIVGWSKRYPDGTLVEDALGGVLDELDAESLIWSGGSTSVAEYSWARVLPWNTWDC